MVSAEFRAPKALGLSCAQMSMLLPWFVTLDTLDKEGSQRYSLALAGWKGGGREGGKVDTACLGSCYKQFCITIIPLQEQCGGFDLLTICNQGPDELF